jgi:mono/diheme cytochrome c family protein
VTYSEFRGRHSVSATLFLAAAYFAAIGFILAACHGKPELTPQQAEGKHLYEVRCAHCHRDNDLALKKVPPDLHGMFARTTLPSGAPATDLQVERTVLGGKGMMPAFTGRFTKNQMDALLAYLHTNLR